jgi:hypothetical protein
MFIINARYSTLRLHVKVNHDSLESQFLIHKNSADKTYSSFVVTIAVLYVR